MTDAKNWNLPQFCLAMTAILGLIVLQVMESYFKLTVGGDIKQTLIAFATLAYAFFFQTSAGARAKDQIIAKQAETVAAATSPPPDQPKGTPEDPLNVVEQKADAKETRLVDPEEKALWEALKRRRAARSAPPIDSPPP